MPCGHWTRMPAAAIATATITASTIAASTSVAVLLPVRDKRLDSIIIMGLY